MACQLWWAQVNKWTSKLTNAKRRRKLPIEGRSEKERSGLSFVTLIWKVFVPVTKTDTQEQGLLGNQKRFGNKSKAQVKRLRRC